MTSDCTYYATYWWNGTVMTEINKCEVSMFPSAGDQVYYNEAGEPLGWDKAEDNPDEVYYCDTCGFSHSGSCPDPYDDTDNFGEPSDDEED